MDSSKMDQLVHFLKKAGLSFDAKGETITVTVPHERVFLDKVEKRVVEHCEKHGIPFEFEEEVDVRRGERTHHYNFPKKGVFFDEKNGFGGTMPNLQAIREENQLREEVEQMELMRLAGVLDKKDLAHLKTLKVKVADLPKRLKVVEVREI